MQVLDVADMGVERGEADEIGFAEVSLAENRVVLDHGVIGELGNGEIEYVEETWGKFEEQVDDLLKEL